MNEGKPQENQQELFSDFAPPQQQQRVERAPGISKAPKPILISTTLEQLLFAGLILILVFCLVFFLGVLRGRYIAGPQFSSARVAVQAPAPVQAQPVVRREAAPAPVRTVPVSTPVRAAAVSVPTVASSAPSAASTAAKPYTIQVLTTKKKAYADTETSSLRARGVNGWMMRSGEYYVVCVGYFKNKEEAKKDLSSLKGKYSSAYLRRR